LDEPVSGLDPIANTVWEILSVTGSGDDVVISSHVLSDLAELCTSVGIMELGYLVESTTLKQLYQRLGRQQIFYQLGELEAKTN